MDKHNGTANCPRGVAISFAFVGTHTDSYKKKELVSALNHHKSALNVFRAF